MRHVITLVLLTLVLLAVGIACSDSDDAPVATDIPATAATAQPPDATATPPGSTATPRPDVEGPCPIVDEAFCAFAGVFNQAIEAGDVATILAGAELASQTCSGLAQIGPCFGIDEGVVLSGYLVGFDASDNISYVNPTNYLLLLEGLAATDPVAVDEYGDGQWELVAVIDEEPDNKVLVTTKIGTDPLYQLGDSARRVFLFRAQLTDEAWQISILLTTVFIEQNLTGLNRTGLENWLPWGEE